jgi:uncharacterized membrane protein
MPDSPHPPAPPSPAHRSHPRWLEPWRVLRSRPRLFIALAVGVVVHQALPLSWSAHPATRLLLAWNAFALLYLALAAHMAYGASPMVMRRRALSQDEGRVFVLLLAVVASAVVLVATASQLAAIKPMDGLARTGHIALAGLTVVTSWLFTQVLLALHYAHDFHAARARHQPDGLAFPGTAEPDYGDFLYLACIIGTSAQTADVSFTSSAMRRVGLLHSVQAFFFNTGVLALTINIAAGLF